MEKILNFILKKEIIGPIITVIVMILIYKILKRIIKRIFKYKSKVITAKKQKTFMNFSINMLRVFLVLITILIILGFYGIETTTVIASLGAVAVVIGLAFQDMLKDFIAGIALVFENSYNVGDYVTINGFKGEVISIGLKTTKIKEYEGSIMIINNGTIKGVINHTAANSLAIIDINVSYDSDIKKVEKVLNNLCKRLQTEVTELKGEVLMLGVEKLADSAIIYRITLEVEAGMQYAVQRQVRKEVKLELDKNNIKIPYNQLVIHSE